MKLKSSIRIIEKDRADEDNVPRDRNLLYVLPESKALATKLGLAGWNVIEVVDLDTADDLFETSDFLVCLVHLTPFNWNEVLQFVKRVQVRKLAVKWVALVSRHAVGVPAIAELIEEYFYDFHTLPADVPRLLVTLGRAHGMAGLPNGRSQREIRDLKEFGLIGESPVMQRLFGLVHKCADVDVPVLIGGESGTGKEHVASAIHRLSQRCNAPFVAVNCGAIPATLIQSELFGHEKGAFTGAYQRNIGRIESAAGGTIFLDEIGDLPLDLQATLLRFLQEKTIERLGGNSSLKVDVRVVAATNVNLDKAVEEGRFRKDLYYRLNVLNVWVPPLRERDNDIELLARFFFKKYLKNKNASIQGFSRQALHAMRAYKWPGNVRELINRVHQAMVMCENKLISPVDLDLEGDVEKQDKLTLEKARATAELDAIYSALRRTSQNISRAAVELGISRCSLYRLMEKYCINL